MTYCIYWGLQSKIKICVPENIVLQKKHWSKYLKKNCCCQKELKRSYNICVDNDQNVPQQACSWSPKASWYQHHGTGSHRHIPSPALLHYPPVRQCHKDNIICTSTVVSAIYVPHLRIWTILTIFRYEHKLFIIHEVGSDGGALGRLIDWARFNVPPNTL